MRINITQDQGLCAELLATLGLTGKIIPTPPNNSVCGFLPLSELAAFVIIENNDGQYVWHLATECTKADAWKYYLELNKGLRANNPRLVFPENSPTN